MNINKPISVFKIIHIFCLIVAYSVILFLFLCCNSTPKSPMNHDLILQISNDPNIPDDIKNIVIRKITEKDKETVKEILKENQSLKSETESNAWKVSFVNGIIYAIIGLISLFALYFIFKFRKLIPGYPLFLP